MKYIGLKSLADRCGITIQAVRADILKGLLFPLGFVRAPRTGQVAYQFDTREAQHYIEWKNRHRKPHNRTDRMIGYAQTNGIEAAAARFRVKPASVRRALQRKKEGAKA